MLDGLKQFWRTSVKSAIIPLHFIADYNTLSKDDIINGVSKYASNNIKEFFAEAFLEYNMTKMPRLISTNVKIIVDFIMKTRRKR